MPRGDYSRQFLRGLTNLDYQGDPFITNRPAPSSGSQWGGYVTKLGGLYTAGKNLWGAWQQGRQGQQGPVRQPAGGFHTPPTSGSSKPQWGGGGVIMGTEPPSYEYLQNWAGQQARQRAAGMQTVPTQRSPQGFQFAPGSGYGVGGYWGGRRRRRMNPLNPKALRRSMSRVQAFAKFAKKTISFTKTVKMKKRKK